MKQEDKSEPLKQDKEVVVKVAYWISSNIAIAIFELISIAPPLVIALNPFASFFV